MAGDDDNPFSERLRIIEGGKAERGHDKSDGGHVRLLGMAELLAAPARDYIVKGWITPGETSLIVGAKNARKSFLALHTGYAVAQGRERVWGRRVKQTAALYVICEGLGGLSQRVRALHHKFGDCSAFFAIAQPIDLLRSTWQEGDLRTVIEHAKSIDAGLIFLDTVSRVMQGGNENGPEDMGLFSANIGELAYRTGAHVCGVHHGTKAEGTSSRGHSLLPNAMEAVATVAWDDATKAGDISLEFARDDITGSIGTFRTETVGLGFDDDGDRITSLVIEETGGTARKRARPDRPQGEAGTHAARAFDILADLCAKEGRTGYADVPDGFSSVPAEWWRERWDDRAMPGELADTKSKAFRRASASLIAAAKVGMIGNRVWITRPETPSPNGHDPDVA